MISLGHERIRLVSESMSSDKPKLRCTKECNCLRSTALNGFKPGMITDGTFIYSKKVYYL